MQSISPNYKAMFGYVKELSPIQKATPRGV